MAMLSHGSSIFGVVGLPIPDETLLVFCGYLIFKGKMNPVGIYFAALAGSCCGITLSYFIGRTLGLGVVHRFGKYLGVDDRRGHERNGSDSGENGDGAHGNLLIFGRAIGCRITARQTEGCGCGGLEEERLQQQRQRHRHRH